MELAASSLSSLSLGKAEVPASLLGEVGAVVIGEKLGMGGGRCHHQSSLDCSN